MPTSGLSHLLVTHLPAKRGAMTPQWRHLAYGGDTILPNQKARDTWQVWETGQGLRVVRAGEEGCPGWDGGTRLLRKCAQTSTSYLRREEGNLWYTSHISVNEISLVITMWETKFSKQFSCTYRGTILWKKGNNFNFFTGQRRKKTVFHAKNVLCCHHLGFMQLFLHTKHLGLCVIRPLNLSVLQQEGSSHTFCLIHAPSPPTSSLLDWFRTSRISPQWSTISMDIATFNCWPTQEAKESSQWPRLKQLENESPILSPSSVWSRWWEPTTKF